ncbi:MAG: hypothetical protein M0P19_08010 [Nevskia sp.]|jgi:phage FluMu gp28-like protein|nr:hypothetical protein [Nevskia sp.]MCK9385085.1 hypothetical protein [Nevskia sp.]
MIDTNDMQPKPIPAVLMEFQARWVDDSADVAIWEKSRRVGASWCTASLADLESAVQGGQDTLYIGYSQDMTREFIDDCAMWAQAFGQVAGSVEEFVFDDHKENGEKTSIKAFRIDFASGNKILALSSRPRSIRGKQGLVIIDEAAFHDDLPGLLKAALALLIWGGKVRVLSSHNGDSNPFNELVLAIRAGKLPYSLHRTTIDDALADGLYQRVCLKTGKQWSEEAQKKWRADLFARYRGNADEELLCIPSQGTGIWLPRALIEARMTGGKVIRYRGSANMALWPEHLMKAEIEHFCHTQIQPQLDQLDPLQRSALGQDFGRHVDLSVIVPMQISAVLKRRVPFIVELSNVPYKAQELILFYVIDGMPRMSGVKLDAGGNGDYLAEQAQNRYGAAVVEKVVFAETWYRENTAPMKSDLEDDLLSLVKDDEVASDLATFRMVRGVPRVPDLRVASEGGGKRHGDAGIAILLAHAASRSNYVPMEFESSGELRASYGMSDYFGETYG